jgi:flagella basal body P-ring formation protein FlgA
MLTNTEIRIFRAVLMLAMWMPPGILCCDAAEFHLRSQCRTEGGLLLLGEVCEIHSRSSDEVKQLSDIDLLPAPPIGEKRVLRLRELQDLLTLRGVNLSQHRFSGASQVTVQGAIEEPKAKPAPAPAVAPPVLPPPAPARKFTPPSAIRHSAASAREAIEKYLQRQGSLEQGREIKFELTEDQAQAIAAMKTSIAVSGGASPWTGAQQFTLAGEADGESTSVKISANVALPPAVVVASHSLARGVLIRPTDVRLQAGKATQGAAHVFQSLEDAIGKETTRVVTEGQVLDDQSLSQQLLVRRGEAVTVYARSGGVQVRTTARSRDDGAHNEVVTVESLAKRESFFARVTGPQEVEIFAHATSPHQDPAAPAPVAAASWKKRGPSNPTTSSANASNSMTTTVGK